MMSLRLHLWKDRTQVAEELNELKQEEIVESLLEMMPYNPSMQQMIHRLLCRDETEASLLYEKSFTQVMQEEYSWKYPEKFEGRLNDFIVNWKFLWRKSKTKLHLIIDFYSKAGRILNHDREGSFLYAIDDFILEEIHEMQDYNIVDKTILLKLCSILKESCNSHGQSQTLVGKIKCSSLLM